METIVTGAASNTISSVVTVAIPPLIQFIDDVINFDQNTQLLQDKLQGLKVLLGDVKNQFQHDQRSPPETVDYWLQKLHHSLQEARRLIDRSQQQKQCLDCLFRKLRLSRQIREWRTNFDELFSDLQKAFSLLRDAQQIAASTPLPPQTLLQPVPEAGFVGLGIQAAETMVQSWLDMEDQFRVIGIYGMGGIGKTSLLRKVHNTSKQGTVFQAVIWITVSQEVDILKMQKLIVGKENLNLGSSSNSESSSDAQILKMSIFTCLRKMKFLLILDDLWSCLDLEEVGIPFGNEKGSKVIISTRSIDVIRRMRANEYSIQIQPLSEEEWWELFCRKAFKDGVAPTQSIEVVARQIAGKCKGLPLAINVVAAAVMGNETVEQWNSALSQVKNADPELLTLGGIDKDLYQPLKWSYKSLPNSNYQNCFLYCGAFPEDAEIKVEILVEMWIAERVVVHTNSRETKSLMDKGRGYVQLLAERCLFEYATSDKSCIKVHDVLRDMAINIAEEEENCLFTTTQNLQNLHVDKGIDNLKRIAIHGHNDIPFLPTDLRCPNLLALFLARNESLTQVPNDFFLSVTSLRVLDMSQCTKIKSLPASTWHLTQLEFLDLSGTSIKNLPEDICNLVRLQFLHLSECYELESLPSKIGELKTLKHLDLQYCKSLTEIPQSLPESMWHLTQLEFLDLSETSIKNLPEDICNLVRLQFLHLSYCKKLKSLPSKIGELKTLKHLHLEGCRRLTEIPREISQLTSLYKLNIPREIALKTEEARSGVCSLEDLTNIPNLRELSVLVMPGIKVDGIRSGIKVGIMSTWLEMRRLWLDFHVDGGVGAVVMEDLPADMHNMKELQSFRLYEYCGRRLPNCICDFKQLERLDLLFCYQLKELPLLERLPNLKSLRIHYCKKLRELGIGRSGSAAGFPMLEELSLERLPRLKSMRSSSSNIVVWSEGMMPNLQRLRIQGCALLMRVPEEIVKLPKLKEIHGSEEWWENLIWEDENVKILLKNKLKLG